MATKRSEKTSKEAETKSKELKESEIFASCSFSSLGLHPTLCDQLRGLSLSLSHCTESVRNLSHWLHRIQQEIWKKRNFFCLIFWVKLALLIANARLCYKQRGWASKSRPWYRPKRFRLFSPGVTCILLDLLSSPSSSTCWWFSLLLRVSSVWCFVLFNIERCRLVNAATGTGKTVAYLAPIIHHLQGDQPRVQRSDGTFGTCSL